MRLIRVLINGSKGSMGLESVKAITEDNELELVAQTDLGDNLSNTIKKTKAEVVVDLLLQKSLWKML